MNIEDIRDYCLSKHGVTEGFPFGEETLVFKVGEKVFLLTGLGDNSFNVKCDPERAIELREQFNEVQPGYHMNKKHWNTVLTDGSLTAKQLKEMIDHSYNLVLAGLPKKLREEIAGK
ncbi:MmcQ/YjbR family DNA-binding protein [Mucilaginibacter achroorhodeus]|uniref:MmcQ/YjbR family DNA-binding protein n=1 Tax=Mucilaginibacter achroorhodeus TaxID=2599294 RepID=A0A563TY61_9SPHI|nr:MmcQ/YjbR family DNA-binding protein [Mucilaginibacter achroorhodeus]TWR24294.1 MmcQ/YjbR family DNA-binding protein [Mucilaginibacter achroorhodeus]